MYRRGPSSASVSSMAVSVGRPWCVRQFATTLPALLSYPGWQTSVSSRKERSKEVKEQERKQRQIEKLPPAQLLPGFFYEHETGDKVVLTDYMFQPTVYADELDTPYLFDLGGSSDFFLHWNVADFGRTQYPPVPEVDHRALPSDGPEFATHSQRALRYAKKHDVVPTFVPHTLNRVNMSVVWGQVPDADQTAAATLTRENFWLTAHCGNFVELKELQQRPAIFLSPNATQPAPEASAAQEEYFTLVIASPDYPFRTSPNRGFYVNTIIANLCRSKMGAESGAALRPVEGDVVLSYTPPLPSEGSGTARVLCMLFRQHDGRRIPGLSQPSAHEEADQFPFSVRSNFRLHAGQVPADGGMSGLRAVEASLAQCKGHAHCVTFLQTAWDIQVQEFYERIGVPEPNYVPEDIEDLLRFNARPPEAERIKGKRRPDGALNDVTSYVQHASIRETDLLELNFSRRTMLSKDGKWLQRPWGSRY